MKTLVVHVDHSDANKARVMAAFRLAERLGAHVIGCHGVAPISAYGPMPLSPGLAGEMIPTLVEASREAAKRLRQEFASLAPASLSGWEWHEEIGHPVDILTRAARLGDLTILSQVKPGPGALISGEDIAGTVAVSSGLPVLALPADGRLFAADTPVLLAWNGSLEASHAIRAALPLLKAAPKVLVVEAEEDKRSDLPTADIAPYLSRHGVRIEGRRITPENGVAAALADAAAGFGAELIVMGAFGHSRLREFLLGGTTRALLHQDGPALLLCH